MNEGKTEVKLEYLYKQVMEPVGTCLVSPTTINHLSPINEGKADAREKHIFKPVAKPKYVELHQPLAIKGLELADKVSENLLHKS